MSNYKGTHTRLEPNGSRQEILVLGATPLEDLWYGEHVTIRVGYRNKPAVVDLMVAAFWGGPAEAFRIYDDTGIVLHVERKIVWQEDDDRWQEKRSVSPATEAEFLLWRSQFQNGEAPTPMPIYFRE